MSLPSSQRHERRWHSGVEARPIARKAENQAKARCAVSRRCVVYLHPRRYKNHNRLSRLIRQLHAEGGHWARVCVYARNDSGLECTARSVVISTHRLPSERNDIPRRSVPRDQWQAGMILRVVDSKLCAREVVRFPRPVGAYAQRTTAIITKSRV